MGIAEDVRADPLFRDRYDLGEPLGSGGMGTVYKGVQRALGRAVAIKLMSPELVGTDELQQRFKAEAQVAAGLIHSNVTAVFDYGIAGSIPYLVTELVEGLALSDILKADRLSTSPILSIMHQVLDGLGAIHALGIVHRDLKPSNLMVRMGNPPLAKILDFGLAKQVTRPGGPQTMVGAIVGTPAYMAPEQVVHDPVCPATDLYALTIIFYEMILGVKPFESDSVMDLVQMQMHQPPAIPPNLLAPARDLLAWGLAKRPADRIPDARTYLDAIETLRRIAEPLGTFWDTAAGAATMAPGATAPLTPAQMAQIASGPRLGTPAPTAGTATAMIGPRLPAPSPPPPGYVSNPATMQIRTGVSPSPYPPASRYSQPAGSTPPPPIAFAATAQGGPQTPYPAPPSGAQSAFPQGPYAYAAPGPPGAAPQAPYSYPPPGPQEGLPQGSYSYPPPGPQGAPPQGPYSYPPPGPQGAVGQPPYAYPSTAPGAPANFPSYAYPPGAAVGPAGPAAPPPPYSYPPAAPPPRLRSSLGLLIGMSILGAAAGAGALAFFLKASGQRPPGAHPRPSVVASTRPTPVVSPPSVAPVPPPANHTLAEVIALAKQLKVDAAATTLSEVLKEHAQQGPGPDGGRNGPHDQDYVQQVDEAFVVLFEAALLASDAQLRPIGQRTPGPHDALAGLIDNLAGPLKHGDDRRIKELIYAYFFGQYADRREGPGPGQASGLHRFNALRWLMFTALAGATLDVHELMATMCGLFNAFRSHPGRPIRAWSAQLLEQISLLAQDDVGAQLYHQRMQQLRETVAGDPSGHGWTVMDGYVQAVARRFAQNWRNLALRRTNPADLRRAMLLTFVEQEVYGMVRLSGELHPRPKLIPKRAALATQLEQLLGSSSHVDLSTPISRQELVDIASQLRPTPQLHVMIDEVSRDAQREGPLSVPLQGTPTPAGSTATRRAPGPGSSTPTRPDRRPHRGGGRSY